MSLLCTRAEGNFTKGDLQEAREDLLFTIGEWFHQIYKNAGERRWLSQFVRSFNWDLVLDQQLFEGELNSRSYGLAKTFMRGQSC